MRTRQQALGQNFLHHQPTIQKITDLAEECFSEQAAKGHAPKCIVEVGPGKLALTKNLFTFTKQHQIPLHLVERDPLLEEEIRSHMGFSPQMMDAASEKFVALFTELNQKQQTPVLFVSNLPYSASSQILANLCKVSKWLSGAVVMVQKELALRMVSKTRGPDRGSFSLLIQSYFDAQISFDVGPGAFNPPPQVTSTVLKLTPLAVPKTQALHSPEKFEAFCKKLFSQRRKMIRGSLPKQAQALFSKLGISGTERPEELELDTVIQLYQHLEEGK